MPYGYAGKILRVNLSTGEITVEEPDDLFYRKYMLKSTSRRPTTSPVPSGWKEASPS